jgi:hypothetical protein
MAAKIDDFALELTQMAATHTHEQEQMLSFLLAEGIQTSKRTLQRRLNPKIDSINHS